MRELIPAPTTRIRFRRYREGDAPLVEAMFSDPLAGRFYPGKAQPEAGEQWIRWNLENYRWLGFGLWVIERRDQGQFLGDSGLTYQSVEGQRLLEVGYHLRADHRGNGYATEASRACLDFAFDRLGARSVCSIVDPENALSIAVASRLHNFQRTSHNDEGRTILLFWSDRE